MDSSPASPSAGDRQESYLRLNSVSIFVRDQNRSLQFYVNQLGLRLAFDAQLPSGDRWVAVAPPDGGAVLSLVAPKHGSDEFELIGRSRQVVFMMFSGLTALNSTMTSL